MSAAARTDGAGALAPPVQIELIVTTYCPFSCSYCYGRHEFTAQGGDVRFDVLARRVDAVLASGLFANVTLALLGGEPLQHGRFGELVEYCYAAFAAHRVQGRVSVVTAGGVSAEQLRRAAPFFAPPTRWQLSLHQGVNGAAFVRFLRAYYLGATAGAREALRVRIVFDGAREGRQALDALDTALADAGLGGEAVDRARPALEALVDRAERSEDRPGGGVRVGLTGGRDVIVSIALASGLQSARYRPDRRFWCPVVSSERPTGFVVDWSGLVRPCSTPNHLLAAPLFDVPVEQVGHAPAAWLTAWRRRRQALVENALDRAETRAVAAPIPDLLRRADICEGCCGGLAGAHGR